MKCNWKSDILGFSCQHLCLRNFLDRRASGRIRVHPRTSVRTRARVVALRAIPGDSGRHGRTWCMSVAESGLRAQERLWRVSWRIVHPFVRLASRTVPRASSGSRIVPVRSASTIRPRAQSAREGYQRTGIRPARPQGGFGAFSARYSALVAVFVHCSMPCAGTIENSVSGSRIFLPSMLRRYEVRFP